MAFNLVHPRTWGGCNYGTKCYGMVLIIPETPLCGGLSQDFALQEAQAGAGTRIMQGKINDPAFPEDVWAKMSHTHGDFEIHYWENLQTGERLGFKFK